MGKEVAASSFLFSIEDNISTPGTPTWQKICGITSFKWGGDDETGDTNSFCKAGYKGQMIVQRGFTLEFEGLYMEDATTGNRDVGQGIVEKYNQQIGQAGQTRIKMITPSTKHGFYIMGTPTISEVGGGTTDIATWNFNWIVDGKPEEFTPTEADLTEFGL